MGLAVQGEAQCCVTGAAFEHMLQLGDQSLLDTVMRNVVVFSRMKSHQKGQVMDLLGSRGLHQVIDGQQQHLAVSQSSHPTSFCWKSSGLQSAIGDCEQTAGLLL